MRQRNGQSGNVLPVIEFVGIPGSGKTTLVQSLLSDSRVRGLDPIEAVLSVHANPAHLALARATQLLPQGLGRATRKHLALSISPNDGLLTFAGEELRCRRSEPNSASRRWMAQTLRLYAGLSLSDGPVLVQEGLYQRLYSARFRLSPSEAFESVPAMHAVCFVDTPPRVALGRLLERRGLHGDWGVKKYVSLNTGRILSDLESNYRFISDGFSALRQTHPNAVLVNGRGSKSEVLAQALGLLLDID